RRSWTSAGCVRNRLKLPRVPLSPRPQVTRLRRTFARAGRNFLPETWTRPKRNFAPCWRSSRPMPQRIAAWERLLAVRARWTMRSRREAVCFGRTWGGLVFAFSWLFFAVASVRLVPSSSANEPAGGPVVLELKLDGEVEPILATYIHEGLQDAARRHASLVLM